MNMIELTTVSKTYTEKVGAKKIIALQDVDLQINRGEVFGLIGPNGAGKSTTIKIVMNLVYATAGKASIKGIDVNDARSRALVGYLPENAFYYDHLTAAETLWFGYITSGLNAREAKVRIADILEKMALTSAANRPLRTYSKGMLQRVGLALALVHDPEIVILDEPMSGLDPLGRKMVFDLILDLKKHGKTVFFSSHILTDIERLCDRVGILVSGSLRVVGDLKELLAEGGTLEKVFLREVEKAPGGTAC